MDGWRVVSPLLVAALVVVVLAGFRSSAQDAPNPAASQAAVVEVVPTSRRQAVTWRYTFARPADNWAKPTFDDGGWKQGPGGFGSPGTPGAVVGTTWNTPDVWLRREVSLPAAAFDPASLQLLVFHDEDVDVYLDGVLAAREAGFITGYEPMDVLPAARALLKPGANLVLAVHCRQTSGGQGIDVGLASVPPGYAARRAAARQKDRYRAFAMSHRGDAAAGEKLFRDEQRVACVRCHTTDGSGTRAGPDLHAAGDAFSRRDLIDSILAPSASIAVGYSTTVVKTRSGEAYDGVVKDEGADGAITLVSADGKAMKLRPDQIAQRRTTEV